MSEIKPVHQKSKNDVEWIDIFDSNYIEDDQHIYRTLYHAAALEALQAENAAQAKRIAELEYNLSETHAALCFTPKYLGSGLYESNDSALSAQRKNLK